MFNVRRWTTAKTIGISSGTNTYLYMHMLYSRVCYKSSSRVWCVLAHKTEQAIQRQILLLAKFRSRSISIATCKFHVVAYSVAH